MSNDAVNKADDFQSQLFVFAEGQTVSARVSVKGQCPFGIFAPANFSGSQLTFKMVVEGETVPVRQADGTDYELILVASSYTIIPVSDFPGALELIAVSDVAARAGGESLKLYVRSVT